MLKLCHLLEDRDGFRVGLYYLRDHTGREVDFLITNGLKPWMAVEAKVGETAIDPALLQRAVEVLRSGGLVVYPTDGATKELLLKRAQVFAG